MEITSYSAGDFCWPELATRDLSAAKEFYTTLFGWTAAESAGEGGLPYTVFYKDGRDVAALHEMAAGAGERPDAPRWLPYVSVKSADETAARLVELGGAVLLPPFGVLDSGRKAVLADPGGARFGIWQPRRRIGARLMGEPGSFCWNELYTLDPVRATSFYTRLFAWRSETTPMPGPPHEYTIFTLGEMRVGGMMAIPSEWGPVPPHWMVYFAVANCDAAEAKAIRLGAQSVFPPTDFPRVGRLAILKDPQGAAFALFKAA